jgi:ABC-type phosphate transport system permease subunit
MPSELPRHQNEANEGSIFKLFLIDFGKFLLLLLTSIITIFVAVGVGIYELIMSILPWIKRKTQ